MRKIAVYALSLMVAAAVGTGCGSGSKENYEQAEEVMENAEEQSDADEQADQAGPIESKINDRIDYGVDASTDKAFIVISKKYEILTVYAPVNGDTLAIMRYPVCLARNKGNKEKKGDCKTPESTMEKPFTISQIQRASDWKHDFGDGRGEILSYGDWFLRLKTPPHTGIGIHGSTNNEETVPGRASEGCIRLKDADIAHLRENYAREGMKVVIKSEDQEALPFETRVKNLK